MTDTIMPCFRRHPREGAVIGCLLAGYGELELEMCACIAVATKGIDHAIREIFSRRGEENRIRKARSLARQKYIDAGLAVPFLAAMEDMDWCREIRNQYAHCHWSDKRATGLAIHNLEELAKGNKPIQRLTGNPLLITLGLLQQQESFFRYVQRCFWYLADAYKINRGVNVSGGYWALPPKMPKPLKHN